LETELDRNDLAEEASAQPPLDAGLLNGSDSAQMGQNVARNLKERRIIPVIGVFERH
jgi:hypothetical protein